MEPSESFEASIKAQQEEVEFENAVRIVRESGSTLISHLQRKMQTRYHSAAILLEKMEKKGIVSPMDEHGRRYVRPVDNFIGNKQQENIFHEVFELLCTGIHTNFNAYSLSIALMRQFDIHHKIRDQLIDALYAKFETEPMGQLAVGDEHHIMSKMLYEIRKIREAP